MAASAQAREGMGLTRGQRHLYAVGHFGVSLLAYPVVQWLSKFYYPGEHKPGATVLVGAGLVAWLLLIGRITDGINDPLMGYFSDKLRTRWGRRKPFMVCGLPLVMLFFLLLWYPPAQGETVVRFWVLNLHVNFCFGAVVLVLCFAALTAYVGPYLALLPEIARDTQEKVGLAGLQGIYNVAGLIVGSFMTGEIIKAGLGFQVMAWVVAGVALVALMMPFLGATDDPARVAGQKTPPFIESVRMTLANRPFRIYVISQLLFFFGLLMIVQALPYMSETLLGKEEGYGGTLAGIALLTGMICVPLILKIAGGRGQKAAYLFSMLWFTGTTPLLALLGLSGATSWGAWLAPALMVINGVAVGGLFGLPYGILAEITEHDRYHTGMERQGMFFCVQGLVLKFAYAGAPATVVGLMSLLPNHIVLTATGPLAAVCALGAYLVFRAYPEDEVREAGPRRRGLTVESCHMWYAGELQVPGTQ